MTDSPAIARMCKVLSVDTRVKIIEMLKDRPLCVNAISHHLGISAAAASQHLRIMRDADIVTAEKEGYFVHYQLNRDTLREWKNLADTLFTTDVE